LQRIDDFETDRFGIGKLIRLKTGDVVPIQINEGIEVRVEDTPIFHAEIGEVSGQVAVSLSRRI
jgi:flagellar motor switch protein FliM